MPGLFDDVFDDVPINPKDIVPESAKKKPKKPKKPKKESRGVPWWLIALIIVAATD